MGNCSVRLCKGDSWLHICQNPLSLEHEGVMDTGGRRAQPSSFACTRYLRQRPREWGVWTTVPPHLTLGHRGLKKYFLPVYNRAGTQARFEPLSLTPNLTH